MSSRRPIVAAFGGDRAGPLAYEFGAAVGRSGCILLTGGGVENTAQIKDLTAKGAREADAQARFVGILPSTTVRWHVANNELFVHTGLPHNVRNLINGLTPDVVVVFGGGCGTLAEAGFAAAAGKPIFFLGSGADCLERLKRNYQKCYVIDAAKNVDLYLDAPLRTFHSPAIKGWTPDDLRNRIQAVVSRSVEWNESASHLVSQCLDSIGATDLPLTGFPGLPSEPGSKARFESEIQRISA
jgi:uncharacterized protein (TIGR00725 family)